jgi:hypothetical protein
LNDLGFIWNSHDAVWEERLNELLLFKKMYGHCMVPSSYDPNPQLAVWVKRQRRQYKFLCGVKPTSMTLERIAKLEQHGFAWDCRKNKEEDAVSSSKTPIVSNGNSQITSRAAVGRAGKDPEKVELNTSNKPAASSQKSSTSYPHCEFLSFGSRRF